MLTEEEEFLKKFGENIRKFREERNMTTDELSIITGIREQYFKRIEADKAKRLNIEHLFIFSEAFKLKPHEIVNGL